MGLGLLRHGKTARLGDAINAETARRIYDYFHERG